MMRGRYPMLLALAGALVFGMACSLSAALPAQISPTIESLSVPTQRATAFIDARSEVLPTEAAAEQVIVVQGGDAQPQPIQAQSGAGGTSYHTSTTYYVPSYCSPRGDWYYSYVVRKGDTLSNIAQRAGVAMQVLAQGNCISNPNLIYAGQALRTPRQVTYVPPPQYPPPHHPPPHHPPGHWQLVGQVLPSPFVSINSGQYELQAGTVVTLSWAVHTAGVTRVEFYFSPSGTGASTVLIGTDTYFGDGVSIAWAVPSGLMGHLSAAGFYGSGMVKQTANYTFVYANSPPPPATATPIPPVVVGSGLTFTPYGEINNNTVMLPPDELITIQWNGTFPTATNRVVFQLVPPGGGTPQEMGADINLGDGATIVWRVLNETQGTVRAVAYFDGGYPPQYSDSYYVIARMPYP